MVISVRESVAFRPTILLQQAAVRSWSSDHQPTFMGEPSSWSPASESAGPEEEEVTTNQGNMPESTSESTSQADLAQFASRIAQAISNHDLEALADCFEPDYQSDFPAHPGRGFRGRDQLRRNWTQIFAAVPQLHADVLSSCSSAGTFWIEWAWRGTSANGAPFSMRGVTIQGMRHGRVAWVRLYMEPETPGSGPDEAFRRQLQAGSG